LKALSDSLPATSFWLGQLRWDNNVQMYSFWTYVCGAGLEVERDADGFSIASDALDEATSISSDASEVVEDDSEQIKSPEEVARRCTDSGCVWLWAACLASFAVCILLGTLQEERHQFVRLTNKRGTQCGVFDQKGKEFWFLCTANESSFADSIATCVPNCAMGSDLNSYCEDAAFAEDATLGGNSTPSNNYTYLARQAGPLCVPVHAGRASSFRRQLVERGFLSIDMFLTAESSWPPLVFAAVLSVAISHSWIRVLRDHAGTLAWVGVYLLVVFPIGVLAYEWLQSGYVSIISMTLTAVVVCCISCLACRSQENLDRATLCLNAACQCVTDMPILQVGPVATLALQLVSGIAILWALQFMPTTLHIDLRDGRIGCQAYGGHVRNLADVSIAGIYILFLLFVLNVMNAFWEMGIVFLTVQWFVHLRRSDDPPPFSKSLRILCIMCRYHAGTIIFAGILIGFVRPLRFLLGTMTAATRMRTNPVKDCCMSCCSCLVGFYRDFLEPLSVNAYVDVALHGSSLLHAAGRSQEVTDEDRITANSLNGMTFVFQIICVALTWWFGFVTAYIAVTMVPAYRDSESPSFIRNTAHWCIIGGCVAAACAYPFVMVFDVASDTILYLSTDTVMEALEDDPHHPSNRAATLGDAPVMRMLYSIAESVGLGCGGGRP